MASKILATLLAQNAKVAQTYQAPPSLSKLREAWTKGEGVKGTVILSCSDPRVIPERYFGMNPGQGAIIRNAGGRAMDAMRSILVLNAITPLAIIVVVHHTDCGTTHVHDDKVRQTYKDAGSTVPADEMDAMKFGEILDLEKSIRDDVALIESDPMFGSRKPEVVGLLYDVETGLMKQVVPPLTPARL